jgi:hypothetical protein
MPNLVCPDCQGVKWEYEPDDVTLFGDRVETVLVCSKCKKPGATLVLFTDGHLSVKWSRKVEIQS